MDPTFRPVTCRPDGDLAERALRTAERLERDVYEPAVMYARQAAKTEGWPGDTEGRLLLGQVLLGRALGRTPATLDALLAGWDAHLNARGYFGAIRDDLDEQQLASHGWVLRGLCELHAWRGDAWSRDRIAAIVDHLVLPCRGVFASYPIDHRTGLEFGMHSGHNAARRDRWRLSTDVGAVFILLDGAVQAWQVVGGDALLAVCVEMAERFLAIDVVALGLQTHATLTTLRGLLRLASVLPGRGDLVAAVAERFACYRSQGMTETWANHNWFNKPRWTEPCAIVDSLQVARQLWMATGDVRYRDVAQLIRWNGLVHGQRANGGFGPDTCTGSDPAIGGGGALLRPSVPEATWCCSMRGAEGLADLIDYQVVAGADGWYLPWMESCHATDATGSLQVTGAYPDAGRWHIVRRGVPVRLHLAAPGWTGDWQVDGQPVVAVGGWVVVDVAADAAVTVTCTLALERQERQGERNQPGWSAWRHGPCILAAAGAVARETPVGRPQRRGAGWELDGQPLLPLSASWRQPMVVADDQRFAAWSRQVLWRVS